MYRLGLLALTATVLGCGAEPLEPLPQTQQVDLTVLLVTEGPGLDDDGFELLVNGRAVGRLAVGGLDEDSLRVDVTPGSHKLRLRDLEGGCQVFKFPEDHVFTDPGNRVEGEVFCRSFEEREVAFTVVESSSREIHILDTDSTWVLRPDGASEWHASWSPDGSRLVMVSNRDENAELYIADPAGPSDGSADVRVTFDAAEDSDPAWSPDGQLIAFLSDREGTEDEIWVVDVETTEARRVTDTGQRKFHPSWSRDSRWIAYSTVDTSFDRNIGGGIDTLVVESIKRVSVDGGDQESVMNGWAPVYSTDGSRMFSALSLGPAFGLGRIIASRDLDGTSAVAHSARDENRRTDTAVSPDGRYVLFADETFETFKIFATELESGETDLLTTGPGEHRDPAWRPDPPEPRPQGDSQ